MYLNFGYIYSGSLHQPSQLGSSISHSLASVRIEQPWCCPATPWQIPNSSFPLLFWMEPIPETNPSKLLWVPQTTAFLTEHILLNSFQTRKKPISRHTDQSSSPQLSWKVTKRHPEWYWQAGSLLHICKVFPASSPRVRKYSWKK